MIRTLYDRSLLAIYGHNIIILYRFGRMRQTQTHSLPTHLCDDYFSVDITTDNTIDCVRVLSLTIYVTADRLGRVCSQFAH